jgi:hypothetical protein
MQQLSGGLSLNVVETLCVAGLKTPDNTPDAALTPRKGKKGGFMLAFRSLLGRAKHYWQKGGIGFSSPP